jgi:hypothetical protein
MRFVTGRGVEAAHCSRQLRDGTVGLGQLRCLRLHLFSNGLQSD